MKPTPATLAQLQARLESTPADFGVVFRCDRREIGGGYHVTELKHASLDSIDCGGRMHRWREAHLQLLDAPGDRHMRAGKLAGILRKSLEGIPALRDVPMQVEFAPQNRGIGRHRIAGIDADESRLFIDLEPGTALCKPAADIRMDSDGACCGAPSQGSACGC